MACWRLETISPRGSKEGKKKCGEVLDPGGEDWGAAACQKGAGTHLGKT